MESYECESCGKKFKSDTYSRFCPRCSRLKGTDRYMTIAILLSFLGILGGIVSGNVFRTVDDEFNYAIMIYSWLSVFLFNIFVVAIHSICYRLDLLIDKKD